MSQKRPQKARVLLGHPLDILIHNMVLYRSGYRSGAVTFSKARQHCFANQIKKQSDLRARLHRNQTVARELYGERPCFSACNASVGSC